MLTSKKLTWFSLMLQFIILGSGFLYAAKLYFLGVLVQPVTFVVVDEEGHVDGKGKAEGNK